MLVYLNGEYLDHDRATVSVDDRGFLFGDGVYEVTRARNGRLFEPGRHLRRLGRGLEALGIAPPAGFEPEGGALVEISDRLLRDSSLVNEDALLYSIARSAKIWNDLDRVGVPGIKGVYSHPAAAGGWGMTVVSLEQRYAGHAPQALALAAQVPGGAYYAKWIIAVDDDVDPSNINQVLWAMSTRCNPVEDIDILRQTWSTWLDPTQNPPEERPYGSKALINACMEHRYIKQFSRRTKLRRSVYESVAARWAELGFTGTPPKLWSLDE